jgi:7-cyano-7-deazaguanine synthase
MDSSTLAYLAKSRGYDILALHLNYGQRTQGKELACAKKIAALLNAEAFVEINLDYFTKFGASSLTDKEIRVEEFDPARAHIPNTYVPFRNANLLAIATSFAEARGADAIFIGVQSLDYSGYPDCRPVFIEAFQKVIDLGTKDTTKISLITPFIHMTKTDIPTSIPGPATGTRGRPAVPAVRATSERRPFRLSGSKTPSNTRCKWRSFAGGGSGSNSGMSASRTG